MIRFYLNIISLIKTYMILFDTVELVKTSDFIHDYYKLMDDDGKRIANPIVTKNKIVLLLPIAQDIRINNEINNYVNDQLSMLNAVVYESGVASLLDVVMKTESDDEDFVIKVVWKIKYMPIIISSSVYLTLLILLGLYFFLV